MQRQGVILQISDFPGYFRVLITRFYRGFLENPFREFYALAPEGIAFSASENFGFFPREGGVFNRDYSLGIWALVPYLLGHREFP